MGSFCGFGLTFSFDGFRILYVGIATFMWVMMLLFSREYMGHEENKARYYVFTLMTYVATLGVFLSADLFTTFLFFEVMSFTSYVWVAQEETGEALRAAGTYLAIAVLGGLVMLMGIFLLYHCLGTLRIEELREAVASCRERTLMYVAGGCLAFGFGAKAGAFPLHIWLPKAHPVAPAPASALLSGILTKAGVYGILITCSQMFWDDALWGASILLIGVITMFWGAFLALFSINIKRTLACSSLSQIGFILVGAGMICLLGEESALAARGALLHMVNHSLIKLVLFMAAGAVYMNIHRLTMNEVRGFGRNKPLFHIIFLSGALSIAGVPLFGGYVSKTLLHESIVKYSHLLSEGAVEAVIFSPEIITAIEWIFLISGGLTVAYMTKLYICIFIEKNTDASLQARYDGLKASYMKPTSTVALSLSALAILVLGVVPSATMDRIADYGQGFMEAFSEVESVSYFSIGNLKGALISLSIGTIIYLVIVRKWMMKADQNGHVEYVDRYDARYDLEDRIYRPILLTILPFLGGLIARIGDCLVDKLVVFLRKTVYRDSPIPSELTQGTYFTHLVGSFLDMLSYEKAKIIAAFSDSEEMPIRGTHYEDRFAASYELADEFRAMLVRSMSFGLMLFCIGFIITMFYLLYI
ncbi:MAG: sodium:proton antiporter [Lachnospiraceae bacterium]|nr:sodium:proton antiporter [Lachnospiraceae bacterium]